MLDGPRFELYSGTFDKDACWIEAVRGLANARDRMEAIAKETPGKYFVFSTLTYAVIATKDTTAVGINKSVSP